MTTHALNTPTPAAAPGRGLTVLRYLDLIVLALALPFFLAFSLPLLGYAAIAAVWLIQRVVAALRQRQGRGQRRPAHQRRRAGRQHARPRLAHRRGTILAVGLIGTRPDGLAAAVLAISLFTIYFAAQMVVRPFDEAARKPLPPKESR